MKQKHTYNFDFILQNTFLIANGETSSQQQDAFTSNLAILRPLISYVDGGLFAYTKTLSQNKQDQETIAFTSGEFFEWNEVDEFVSLNKIINNLQPVSLTNHNINIVAYDEQNEIAIIHTTTKTDMPNVMFQHISKNELFGNFVTTKQTLHTQEPKDFIKQILHATTLWDDYHIINDLIDIYLEEQIYYNDLVATDNLDNDVLMEQFSQNIATLQTLSDDDFYEQRETYVKPFIYDTSLLYQLVSDYNNQNPNSTITIQDDSSIHFTANNLKNLCIYYNQTRIKEHEVLVAINQTNTLEIEHSKTIMEQSLGAVKTCLSSFQQTYDIIKPNNDILLQKIDLSNTKQSTEKEL